MKQMKGIILALIIGVNCGYSSQGETKNLILPEEESTWKLSIGAMRRKSSLKLIKSQHGNASEGIFVNGSVEYTIPNTLWRYNVENALAQAAILTEVTYATISENKLDDEYGNGIALKIRNELLNETTFAIDFEIGINLIYFDIDQTNMSTMTNYAYDITANPWTNVGGAGTTIPEDKDYHTGIDQPAVIAIGLPQNGWTSISHYDLEWTVVGLDLGLAFRTVSDSALNLFVSAGPTVSIVFHDSEKETILDYGTSTSLIDSRTGDGIDLVGGMYIEAGLTIDLNEEWSTGLSLRYDQAFNKVKNEVIEIDLSGGSVILYVGYNF